MDHRRGASPGRWRFTVSRLRRVNALLSALALASCSLFVIPPESRCEGPELSCDGDVLVFCDQDSGFQLTEDCAASGEVCNPADDPPRCELLLPPRCGDGV